MAEIPFDQERPRLTSKGVRSPLGWLKHSRCLRVLSLTCLVPTGSCRYQT